jgi:hypothetical protein
MFNYRGELLSESPCFGDGFELPVDILGIALLSNANTAYDYDLMLRIDSVNDAMVSELVLPITCQRPTQRQSVSFRVNSELLFQDLAQLLAHTAVEPLNILRGI